MPVLDAVARKRRESCKEGFKYTALFNRIAHMVESFARTIPCEWLWFWRRVFAPRHLLGTTAYQASALSRSANSGHKFEIKIVSAEG
jgi:hypothetical protein